MPDPDPDTTPTPTLTSALAAGAARALLPLAAVLALVALVDYADWGEGPTRAAGLALFAAGVAWVWRRPLPAARERAWLVAALAVALLRLAPAAGGLSRRGGAPNDIGWTTVRAVETLARGRSPYAALVDPQRDLPRREPGLGWFMGYKYGPLVPRWYAPFLRAFGAPRGLYLANAVLLAAAALLAALLAARAGGLTAALAAAVVVLWPSFARFELFAQGVNDLLPTALALAALLAAAWGRRPSPRPSPSQGEGDEAPWARSGILALLSGAALGLSLSAKPLPGALLLLLLPGTVRALPFAAGVLVGLLPYVPDLLATPRELVANLVLFNLERPGDSTGAGAELPAALAALPQLAGALLVAAVVVAYHRGRRSTRDLAVAAALVATLFLAGGKLIHRNYLLWWLPLAAVALGASCYRDERAPSLGTAP